ncbi:hypothetical protein AVEN_130329-1 [Araneus ventricosus]|uniref:Tc1-like transposase DDE domain-containing protein n=1 Tax=Araneus ventricosus TaxID=182803 RepID=A0A4Y2BGE7_ARAVE|nr:hypothetical protein AVEN_130329-1 [Araneus ventricosus]
MFGSDVSIVLISMQEKAESLIRQVRGCLLSREVFFLDDNARPHTARDTKEHNRRLVREILNHKAYSPELAPSDFHLFPALKSTLSGHAHETGVKAVKNFLRSLGTDFYEGVFLKLI